MYQKQPPSLIIPMLKEIEKNEEVDIVAYYQDNRIENKMITRKYSLILNSN